FQAEDGIRDYKVTGVQTCALPISPSSLANPPVVEPSEPASAVARRIAQACFTMSSRHCQARGRRGVPARAGKSTRRVGGMARRQIGRASCRERVESAGGGVALRDK